MKYCGIDLHSNNSLVSVIDDEDHVVAERRVPNDLEKIIGLIQPWQTELAGVVVESTFSWYWLVDGLRDAGYTVHLAHTTAIKKYAGLKHSGDEADARHLAHLLRLGILPTGTILAPEHRAVRDLARKRMQLVRSRTTHILAVENITARQYGVRITSNQVKQLTTEMVDEMPFPNDGGLAVSTACTPAMARKRERAIQRTATSTWPGRLWRLPFMQRDLTQRQNGSTKEGKPKQTTWWQSRRWRTNWRERIFTC
jgi:Transposase